jgi:hypothetical protein
MITQVAQFFARVHSEQLLALFCGQPIPNPNAQTLGSSDPANACGQVWA